MPRAEASQSHEWLRRQTNQVETRSDLVVSEETATAVEIEAWLQRREVQYAPATNIPMNMIDTKRSRSNQARRDPLVTESVDRFAAAMRAGRSFPPIVVYPLGNKLVIIDGNNRHEAAARTKRDHIYGIIIDGQTDGDLIQLLTVEANSSHGVTPPVEWRVLQAFHLVSLGHSDELAAEASGVTLTQLRNARMAREADGRAKRLGIYGFDQMSLTNRQYLNGLKLESVFHAAGRLSVDQALTNDQVRELVRLAKKGTSESEQLALVAEQARLLEAENAIRRAKARRVTSPKSALVSGIGMIMACDPRALVSQIVTIHDRDTINGRLTDLVEKILEIQVGMEKLNDLEG